MNNLTTDPQRLILVRRIRQAWETLNADIFLEDIYTDTFTYTSFWVLETMRGADAYRTYITGKFATLRATNSGPVMELVRVQPADFPYGLRLTQGNVQTLLLFRFDGTRLDGMDMTEPSLFRVTPFNG